MKNSKRNLKNEQAKSQQTPPPVKYANGSRYADKRAKQMGKIDE